VIQSSYRKSEHDHNRLASEVLSRLICHLAACELIEQQSRLVRFWRRAAAASAQKASPNVQQKIPLVDASYADDPPAWLAGTEPNAGIQPDDLAVEHGVIADSQDQIGEILRHTEAAWEDRVGE
jgi:hypothetical protein